MGHSQVIELLLSKCTSDGQMRELGAPRCPSHGMVSLQEQSVLDSQSSQHEAELQGWVTDSG